MESINEELYICHLSSGRERVGDGFKFYYCPNQNKLAK
jgi:hypothetical protein